MSTGAPRLLVVVHVFYLEFWAELAACIRNLGSNRDLIVTCVDSAVGSVVRRDFPDARCIPCENCGFDIWPFLRALQTVDLGKYDCIVKLHTKRNIVKDYDWGFNNCRFNGSVWRRSLLSFCSTPEAWSRTWRCLKEPGVGMVADRHVIVRRRDFPWASVRACFDDAVREIRAVDGCAPFDETCVQYVAGTMFAARPEPLAFLLKRGFTVDMFARSSHEKDGTIVYAHVVENLLGLAVSAIGMRIVAHNGSLAWRRFYAPILRAIFTVKETRRRRIVKVLGVPVSWKRKPTEEP